MWESRESSSQMANSLPANCLIWLIVETDGGGDGGGTSVYVQKDTYATDLDERRRSGRMQVQATALGGHVRPSVLSTLIILVLILIPCCETMIISVESGGLLVDLPLLPL